MNCPRCQLPAEVIEVEPGKFATTSRRYQCRAGHRFATTEAYHPAGAIERHGFLKALRAISETITPHRSKT